MKFDTADKTFIRQINLSLILKAIRDAAPISRADIAKKLKLNPATVSANVRLLLEDDLVREVGSGTSSGGRKPIMLEINEKAMYSIGLDVQKDKVVAAVVDLDGTILARSEMVFKTHFFFFFLLSTIIAAVKHVLAEKEQDHIGYLGLGVAMHGIVHHKTGVSVYAPAFSWHDVPIKEILSKKFRLPVKVDNDARAMALGEKWFGAAGDAEDFVFLNVGSGIGSGIFIGGNLIRGFGGAAGEIGHIKVIDRGKKCVCGKFGCLDTVGTENSIIEEIVSETQKGVSSSLAAAVKDNSKISIREIVEAASQGDALTLQLLKKEGFYLGVAVSDILNILNPELVIIGGEMALAKEFFFDTLLETAKTHSMEACLKGVKIIPSTFDENSGVIGAAAMVIQSIFLGPIVR